VVSETCASCGTCGARWIANKHYWANGAPGNELDLAGLVCNILPEGKSCINPQKGKKGGQTWTLRSENLHQVLKEWDLDKN